MSTTIPVNERLLRSAAQVACSVHEEGVLQGIRFAVQHPETAAIIACEARPAAAIPQEA